MPANDDDDDDDDEDDDDHYYHHYQQYFPAGSSDGVHLALWARQACLPQSSLAFIEGDVDDDDDADADDDDDDGDADDDNDEHLPPDSLVFTTDNVHNVSHMTN